MRKKAWNHLGIRKCRLVGVLGFILILMLVKGHAPIIAASDEELPLEIMSDYTFTEDITVPIVVTADNLVIDGKGHALHGNGSGTGITSCSRINITITNVTIKEWDVGINLSGDRTSSNTISGNTFSHIGIISIALGGSHNRISGNTLAYTEYGISLGFSSHSSISRNTITHSEVGIILVEGNSNNSIANNIIIHNENGIQDGYYLYGSSTNNCITGNIIAHNRWHGIYFDNAKNNVIYHNAFFNNSWHAFEAPFVDNHWHHPELLEGNYWSDYPGVDDGSGTGKHAIAGDGIGDTNIPWPSAGYDSYPLVDTTSPDLSAPSDIIYEEGMIGYVISWVVGDHHPGIYTIYNNSVQVDSGAWTNGTIDFNVDGLLVGIYNFTLIVWDVSNKSTKDTVMVTVTTPPATIHPEFELSALGLTMALGLAALTVLRLWRKRR